ncbi:hypothetical protein [Brevundimonas sp.]
MAVQFESRPVSLPVKIAGFCALAALGGAFGYALAHVTDFSRETVSWDDALAYTLGFSLIALGAMVGLTMVVKRDAVPKGTGMVQIVVFVLAGLMFLAPMVAIDWVSPAVAFAGIVALFAVQTVGNVIAWRRSDEMMRRVMTETSTIAFWGLQSAFFLYAAAERMALIQPISAWGLTGVMMTVYLVSSIVPSFRRGLT